MKICSPQLGIAPNSILGGEIYDRELLIHLGEIGAKIEIILPYNKPYKKNKNWHVTYLPFPFIYPPIIFNLICLPWMIYLYNKTKFDILRIHSPSFLGIAAIVFKKIYPHVPVVANYHWLGEGGWFDRYINLFIIKYFDVIICDSLYTRNQIINKFPYTKKRVYAIHNGVDKNLHKMIIKPSKLKEKYHIAQNKIILLFMGLFIDRKNPIYLLNIVQMLNQRNIAVHLLLCGKGYLENQIIEYILKNNLQNNVTIIPPVFGKNKNIILNMADIFVHPSLDEGFSLSVIEAMSVGLPVVITDAYSAKEAITNKINGFLCRSKTDWIKNITFLIKNKQLINKITKNNIKKVNKKFTWEIAAKKQLAIFQNLINTK